MLPFSQIVSVIGSLIILGAYFALQRKMLRAEQRAYSALNLVGAGLLTGVAIVEAQVGFLLLQVTWALLSLAALLRRPT
jgi:hydrogenase-4 membrane subunit HyfE